jgi:hypothetical protein
VLIRAEMIDGLGRVDIHRQSSSNNNHYLCLDGAYPRGFLDKVTLEPIDHVEAMPNNYARIMFSSLEEAEEAVERLRGPAPDPKVWKPVPLF